MAKTEPEKTGTHGGRREGAGRKPAGDKKMSAGIYIRCTPDVKEAFAEFIDKMNADREARGLKGKVDLSTWLRELGLKYSGNEHLGLAAKARAAAEAAESIV